MGNFGSFFHSKFFRKKSNKNKFNKKSNFLNCQSFIIHPINHPKSHQSDPNFAIIEQRKFLSGQYPTNSPTIAQKKQKKALSN
jgi:hypothetical protein